MKTSTILLLAAAGVVVIVLLSKSGGGILKSGSPTFTGGAGYIAALGNAVQSVGKGVSSVIDSYGKSSSDNADSTTE